MRKSEWKVGKEESPEVEPRAFLIRATGIEPVSHAWEARVLPLNDARLTGEEDTR